MVGAPGKVLHCASAVLWYAVGVLPKKASASWDGAAAGKKGGPRQGRGRGRGQGRVSDV